MGWLVMRKEDWTCWWLVCREIDGPEVGGGGTGAGENGGAVEGDVDGVGVESGGAAVVAEEANGEEGTRGKSWEYVCEACGGREKRKVEGGCVGGVNGAAVWKENGDAGIGDGAIEVRGCYVDVVSCAAGVGDAKGGNVMDWRGGGRIKERSRK